MLSSRPGEEEGAFRRRCGLSWPAVWASYMARTGLADEIRSDHCPGYLPDVIVYPSIELNLRHSHVILPNICPKKKPQRVRKNFM